MSPRSAPKSEDASVGLAAATLGFSSVDGECKRPRPQVLAERKLFNEPEQTPVEGSVSHSRLPPNAPLCGRFQPSVTAEGKRASKRAESSPAHHECVAGHSPAVPLGGGRRRAPRRVDDCLHLSLACSLGPSNRGRGWENATHNSARRMRTSLSYLPCCLTVSLPC